MACRIAYATFISLCIAGCGSDGPDENLPYTALSGGASEVGYGGSYGSNIPEVADPFCNESTPTYEEVTVFNKCKNCHSSTKSGAERKSAPENVNFDTKAGADAKAERAATMVRSGQMPPRSSGIVLNDTEKQQLYEWARCAM